MEARSALEATVLQAFRQGPATRGRFLRGLVPAEPYRPVRAEQDALVERAAEFAECRDSDCQDRDPVQMQTRKKRESVPPRSRISGLSCK